MNAAVVEAFDAPPRYAPFADPIPEAGEQLVRVTAAGLHPIVKGLASGSHYGSGDELPIIPGVDGVGVLQADFGEFAAGTRVYFGLGRAPFGTFAEVGLASAKVCIPLPDGLPDAVAAGIANPAMSSWVALNARAQFVPGESVLILGATGVAGQLAVQIAKRLGAKRVVAAGRNPEALAKLPALGADAVISLDQPVDALVGAFREELNQGVDIVLDYVWGLPADAVLEAISKKGLKTSTNRVRFINIGSGAGPTVALAAATLRSSGLELLGSGFGSASLDEILAAVAHFFNLAAREPFNFGLKIAPLREIESLWAEKEQATRLVLVP